MCELCAFVAQHDVELEECPSQAGDGFIVNSTTARAITWTAPTKVGATYKVFCKVAPSSGTHTLTMTAGTVTWQGTSGSVINLSLAGQMVTVNVIAANDFWVSDNVGTVTLS